MDTNNNSDAALAEKLSFDNFRNEVLKDYRIVCESRETSLIGRKEVLTGKAKFGIFGDGNELAQVAMAKFFKPGDFRSGYYRDQTFMMAAGLATAEQIFAQLYADPDGEREPFSSGRQMNCHFATKMVNEEGGWLNLTELKNVSSDIAPTGGQMPRALGLAFASKAFRNIEQLKAFKHLSDSGNEVCFATIGDASTSEGHFWETINAAGVLQVPLAVFVWDDGYGISVPKKYQTTKASVSDALKGVQKDEDTNGINIYKVKGWDYAGMCEVFEAGLDKIRQTHIPAVFHVEEITQPQGHSTSGSHERYKDAERLQWEREWDCIKKMKEWIIENTIATDEELELIEEAAKETVKQSRSRAWDEYTVAIKEQAGEAVGVIRSTIVNDSERYNEIQKIAKDLETNRDVLRRDIMRALSMAVNAAGKAAFADDLINYHNEQKAHYKSLYNSHL